MDIRVKEVLDEIYEKSRLSQEHKLYQHGDTTIFEHSVSVAEKSLQYADMLGIKVDTQALVRGALLHDYFLYDWHVKDKSHRLHGFFHPGVALKNAREDFDLTPVEEEIIRRHMFPLTPIPPKYREAWLVCLADKYCATCETVQPFMHKLVIGA